MSHVIRLAGLEDRPAVEAIVQSAYAPYLPRIGRKPGPMLDDYAARIDAGQVHVIESDGAIHGILVLIPRQGSMLLDNIAVRPGAQGLGHGRKLLEFAERAARDAGYESIRLYTNEAMIENIALYSRIGFVETHRVEEKGLRRVYMAKPLAK
jgi:GNAT superfamily N-acetyltransferase